MEDVLRERLTCEKREENRKIDSTRVASRNPVEREEKQEGEERENDERIRIRS